MNAEIAKEMVVFAAYGDLLNEADAESLDAAGEALGDGVLRRISEYVDAVPDGCDFTEECIAFLRQQVRESAERLLALIDAEGLGTRVADGER